MNRITRMVCIAAMAMGLAIANQDRADAGYPVYYAPVQPVVPAVVGYSARRAGLFGRRVVVNPVVAPVAAAPVVVARPVVAAPVVAARYDYVPAPVYYRPAVEVTTYRVPVTAYVPIW